MHSPSSTTGPAAESQASSIPPPQPRSKSARARSTVLGWTLAGALALFLVPTGCDSPDCVFAGNCGEDGTTPGELGTQPATLPNEGELLLPSAPSVIQVSPSGTSADTRTPVVIVFDEAMSPSGINSAFRIAPVGSTFAEAPYTAVLIGSQRVLVLLPTAPLQAGTSYEVRYRETIDIEDRTGQPLIRPAATDVAGTFTVGATNGPAPKLVTSFPPTGSIAQSPTTEIITVFDRPLNPGSVTSSSFVVTVDGTAPASNPPPQPLSAGGGIVSDTRVWRYRSVDADGTAVPLGLDADVSVALSPTGHPILDAGSAVLAPTTITFTTLPFGSPSGAAITSQPSDAIGIDQLSGPANLAVLVELEGAQDGDHLELYLFGTKTGTTPNPPLTALLRDLVLEPPLTPLTLVASEIDLVLEDDPLAARFADGKVAFAFQLRRGTARSPLHRLDVDPDEDGPQDPVLDTKAPVLEGLSTSGSVVSEYRSDQRDLVIVGRASEPLRAALVVTSLGNNASAPGVPPPVVGSHAAGLFVAAPVELGIVAPGSLPLDYRLTIFDRALNRAPAATGLFTQIGASGPGAPLPGPTVTVDVFSATTGLPIAGAIVSTHDFEFDLVTSLDAQTTSATGSATLVAAFSGDTIVTVDARSEGYSLFTFDGVPTARLGVPLQLNVLATASVTGQVATDDPDINLYQRRIADARTSELAAKLYPVNACTLDPIDQRFECPYNALPIRPLRIGSQSALAIVPPPNLFLYSPLSFLKGFELSLPLPTVQPGGSFNHVVALPFLLDQAGLDPEELPIDVLPHVLSSTAYPTLALDPEVTVEALSPGAPGSIVVGAGVAFPNTPLTDSWTVRAAYPGAADGIQDVATDELGRLVEQGTLDPDLFVRCELEAADGTRAGARPRLSSSGLVLDPPAVPLLASPPVVLNLGAEALDLTFADVLPDLGGASAVSGLYRITLTDANGLHWIVWRLDPPGALPGDVTVHLPFVGPNTTWPMQPGDVSAQVSAFAWASFDPLEFLWSDVEREHELYVHAVSDTFTYP